MSETDLHSDEGLAQACAEVVAGAGKRPAYLEWGERLLELLEYVQAADLEIRASEEFARRIWEDNAVSAVGSGQVPVDKAIESKEFRMWLAEKSLVPLPEAREARAAAIEKLFEEIQVELKKYTTRNPRLKLYRVMAAFFPRDFTSIAYIKSLRKLRMQMLGRKRDKGPRLHMSVLRRLEEVLGSPGTELPAIADRMRLPWLLYSEYVAPSDEDSTETVDEITGAEKLVPLPAARRRRGLTGFTSGLDGVLNTLEFCRDGVPREELANHIKTINPNLKESSIGTNIGVLTGELNVLRSENDLYVLTERGETLLESGDANDLMDWLVTHILAVDHVLVHLRDNGPTHNTELVQVARAANPGWTSTFAPTILISTLKSFGMLERDDEKIFSLTEDGQGWAERIDWTPEFLAPPEDEDDLEEVVAKADEHVGIALPKFSEIYQIVSAHGHFPENLVARLHAGIWAHKRRHFAILTGLSGSGKTLLARAYGKAVLGTDEDNPKELRVTPIQPGWYDPTALLGFVNPLQAESYVRTPFLEFLLAANSNPEKPYIAVLDEMNLSRPEQYLAPVLSAMETGLPIALHREGDLLDGIPSSVRYPSNLVIIGTVNMDETTHGLSDKVLDRAFTIEFWKIDLDKYPGWGSADRGLPADHEEAARALLTELMDCLENARLHFGWRTVDDVLDYLAKMYAGESGTSVHEALDSVVYAKILPKLRGEDSQRFRNALQECEKVFREHGLNDCQNKTKELLEDLELTGSARFWR